MCVPIYTWEDISARTSAIFLIPWLNIAHYAFLALGSYIQVSCTNIPLKKQNKTK